MKYTKQLFMILLVVFLLVGLGTLAASDVTKNDTSVTKSADVTKTSTVSKDARSASKVQATEKSNDNNKIVDTKPNSKTNENLTNKTIKKTNSDNSVKSASKTVTVSNYDQLRNNITQETVDTLTINLISGTTYIVNNQIRLNNKVKTLTINGNGATINGNNQDIRFLNIAQGYTATLNNINIIKTGNGSTSASAIFNNNGKLTIINCTFSNNYGDSFLETNVTSTTNITKSIFKNNNAMSTNIRFKGTCYINNNTFTNNYARQNGAAFITQTATIIITNNTFRKNVVDPTPISNSDDFAHGGTIHLCTDTTAEIYGNTFIDNSARIGGAIYAHDGNGKTKVDIHDNIFKNNNATAGGAVTCMKLLYYNSSVINNTFISNFADTHIGALYGYNCNISVERNKFINNSATSLAGALAIQTCNATIINNNFTQNNATYGGAIYSNNSNLTITNSNLTHNNATINGGAIIGYYSNITITNSNLNNNNANERGGAIYNGHAGRLTITNTNLNNNTATDYGGAIYNNATLTITHSNLTHNTAKWSGAIHNWHDGNMTITNSNLSKNKATEDGGAIYYDHGKLIITQCIFTDNTANSGGAIRGSVSVLTISNSTFTNNTANRYGGAIGIRVANITISNSNLNNNTAKWGGAIGGPYYNNITIINSNLNNNTATEYGGAIHHGINNVTNTGGAIGVYINSNLTVTNSNITHNTANRYGGAIYIGTYNPTQGGAINISSNNITITQTNLNNNTAAYSGGAIYNSGNLTLTDSTLNNNNATQSGGAINNDHGTLTINNSNLTHNNATKGGAIYANTNSTLTITNTNLTNNTVTQCGGAIYEYINSTLTITNTSLTRNNAAEGGAIYGYGGKISINESRFEDNNATEKGGAISVNYGNLNVNNTLFNNNKAMSNRIYIGGGAIRGQASIITVNNSELSNNSAYMGGAIYGYTNTHIRIINSELNGNVVPQDGAVIYGYSNTDITIIESSLCNNTGGYSGAIMSHGNLTITKTNLTNNLASSVAAIFCGGNTTITSSIINNNTAIGYQSYGAVYTSGNLSIFNTSISYNKGTNSSVGAGLQITSNSNVLISESTLNNNSATRWGGAIRVYGANLTIINSSINNNTATNYGGAMYVRFTNMSIYNSNLTNNHASTGGAIHAEDNNNITISNSNLNNNNASHGGAIRNEDQLIIHNCTLNNNNAIQGGAVYGDGNISIEDSTFTNNSAEYGGAIQLGVRTDNINLNNNTFTNNYVIGNRGYVIYLEQTKSVVITENIFINNTDNKRDMLFSDAKAGASLEIRDNIYIDNYLATNITQLDNVTVRVLEDETYAFPVNVTVRSIYNHTVNNGSVYVKSDKIDDNYDVRNSQTTISVDNLDLELPVNQISYNYTSLNKHYQNVKTSFEIYKHIPTNLTITLDPEDNVNVSKKVQVTITLADYEGNKLPGHEIAILINGKKHTLENNLTDENGEINFNYTVPAFTVNDLSGLLVFEAIHHETQIGSYYDTSESVEKSLTINKMPTHIHIDYQTSEATEANTFNVTITLCEDETTHNKITGQRVYYNITSIDGQTLINNGFFTSTAAGNNITINTLPMEGYIVNAWFEGFTQYFETSETEEIIPNYIGTETEVIVSGTTYINQSKEITIKLLDSQENPMTDGSVVWIQINNQTPYAVPVINGEYKFNYTSNISGEINITATFNRTTTHSGSSGTGHYFVEELPTHTTLVVENSKVENTTIIAYINDTIHNKPVNGGTINITENGRLLQTLNVENGIATFTITGLTAGEHDLEAFYSGVDQIYVPSEQNTRIFEVEKTNTHTIVEPISILVCNETVTINVKITDENGKNITTGTVNITVDMLPPINNIAVNSGLATVTINNLPAGTYNINATYNGDDTYNPSSNKTTLTVNKIPTNTIVQILDNTLTNVTIKVTVTNSSEEKVVQGNITVLNENDEIIPTLTEKTLENGECIITIPATTAGTFKIKVKYNENDIYLESYAKNQTDGDTITIDVTLIPTITKAEILTNTLDNVTIKVTTTNTTGYKVSKGNIIIFNTKDEIIATSPLQNGETIVKLPLTVLGENKIKVEYQENDIYDKSYAQNETTGDNEITINVEKIPTKMTMDVLDTALGNVTIKVTVTNTTGDKVTHGDITLLDENDIPIPGLTQIELENGEQVVTIPSEYVGENIIISILYNENDIYKSCNYKNESLTQDDPNHDKVNITVSKIPTITSIEILNTKLDNVTIKVTVTNKTEDKVTTGSITILDKDNNPIEGLTQIELENGQTTIKIPSETVGENIIITVHYNENEIYLASNARNNSLPEGHPDENKTNITVTDNKIPTKITATTTNGTHPTANITLTDEDGNPINGAPITITDPNGKPVGSGTTNEDGKTTITLDIATGSTDITITYPGNQTYHPSNTTQTVTKNKHNTTINVTDDKNGTITINITDEKDKPVPNIPVNITLPNGTPVANGTTDENGTITIPLTLEPGDYNITITTPGDKDHNGTNKTITVTIPPKPTDIEVKVNNGTNPTVDVKLSDEDGNPINGAPITITDPNGKPIGTGTTDKDGKATIPIDIPTGNTTITITYPGNQTYQPTNKTAPSTKDKHTITITPKPNNNATITINTTNEENKPVPNIPINITDKNGNPIGTATTDQNGEVTIPIPLEPGTHEITITTPGDENNNPTTTKTTVTIPPKDTKINTTVTDPTKGNTTIKVNLTDDKEKPVSGAQVTVTLPNGTKVPATTGRDGTIEIPVDLPVGNNQIKVEYPGNATYKPISQNIPVNVQKTPTTTTITVLNNTAGNVKVTGRVLDKYGRNVPEGTVTIKEGNNTVGTGQVTGGTYSIITSIGNKGIHTLTAQYSGTNNYLPSSSQTITPPVEAITPTMTTKIEGNKVGNTTVTATLKDPQGKAISGAQVTVTLANGTKVTGTTNSNGVANIPVDFREGENTITTTYSGNGTYNPVTTKNTLNVTKNTPVIKLNPVRGVIGENITLTAYLTDENGSPITGGNLAFKLNGKTLRSDGRFDSNAPAMKFSVKDGKVTYTIKADLYLRNAKNLTAAYSGNYKYKETGSPTVEAQIQKRYAGVTLTVTPTQNKQYDTIKFTATVRDTTKNGKNQTLINQNTTVMFKVNGNTLKDKNKQIIYVPVNANKQATYNYQIPAGTGGITASKAVRDYKVEAIFVGINYYPGARNNSKFNVERSSTTVTIKEVKVVAKTNVLSVKATLTDYKGNNLIGTNKVTVKINGRSYIDPKNGKPKYWSVKNGVVDLSGITVDPKTTIKRVMVVTGERQAYTEGRAESTTIVRA